MNAVGIILAGGNNAHMKALSEKRAIAAMHVASSYRAIDFTLSNMTNSNIQTVGIITQYNSYSLSEHLNSSKWWNFGRKQGGMYLLSPTITPTNNWWYRGTADALWHNVHFLERRHEPYVVISGADCVYKADFSKIIEYHNEKQADITVVCTNLPEGDDASRYGSLDISRDGVIKAFEEKSVKPTHNIVSTGIYIMRRRRLIELLEEANNEGCYNFVTDVIIRRISTHRIYGYMLDGYWSNISSIESYYRTNMDFLKKEVREYFFEQDPVIYTKALDMPPAKYNPSASVKNSLIGSGTIINGRIENSVIFKDAFIGNDCEIKNSIILQGAYIGNGTKVENCIIETNEVLADNAEYLGEKGVRVISGEKKIV